MDETRLPILSMFTISPVSAMPFTEDKVTYFAGPDGYVHDPDGVITDEKLNFILEMRAKDPMHCKPYADKFGVEFVPGEKCWGVKDVDVYTVSYTHLTLPTSNHV